MLFCMLGWHTACQLACFRCLLLAVVYVTCLTTVAVAKRIDAPFFGWQGEIAGIAKSPLAAKEVWDGEIVQLSWSPRAFLLKGFLSDAECDHIIDLARDRVLKSEVVNERDGSNMRSNVRTSAGTFLQKAETLTIDLIERRIAQVTMLPVEHQEGMQVLRYSSGQKYDPHFDYFSDAVNTHADRGGQRLATVLMYLTTPEEGGETVFPNADVHRHGPQSFLSSSCTSRGLVAKPTKGDAVLFFSLKPDGSNDPASLHGSCPTIKGVKWAAPVWIHTNPVLASVQQLQDRDRRTGCYDDVADCKGWAARGECSRNPKYMHVHCRKACRNCGAAPANVAQT